MQPSKHETMKPYHYMNLTASLSFNQKTVELPLNKMTFFEEVYVDFKTIAVQVEQQKGTRLQLTIHPKQPITLQNIRVQYPRNYHQAERIFCNGYQTWTESREFALNETISKPKWFAQKYLDNYGDYTFTNIQRSKGHFHAWSYSYVRLLNGKMEFIGSLNEKTAFTIIQHDTHKNIVNIDQDCEGLVLEHSFPIMDIVLMQGEDKAVFDAWQNLMGIAPPTAKPALGWTSWYHYYTKVSEDIIIKNLNAFAEKESPIDIFQIDDGYQEKVGDWLTIKNTFPSGMRIVAEKIHQKGYQAGLWLAPFICEKASKIYQQHPHWILKDKNGKMVQAGHAVHWSGMFYALDIYHQEVRDYLTKVFHVVLNQWGYDMVKLDFLYAACIIPRSNKTRGQVMSDAMAFLRQLVGNKLILSCGVPLASAFGLVDYCRIGADIALKWTNPWMRFLGHRERVSTIVALRTTLGRWHLNKRFFQNDPDVFILRKEKNNLSPVQQYSVLLINTLLGSLLFTSDFVGDYSDEQWGEYHSIQHWLYSEVLKVENLGQDKYLIYFKNKGNDFVAVCNLSHKKTSIQVRKQPVELEAFESLVLKK